MAVPIWVTGKVGKYTHFCYRHHLSLKACVTVSSSPAAAAVHVSHLSAARFLRTFYTPISPSSTLPSLLPGGLTFHASMDGPLIESVWDRALSGANVNFLCSLNPSASDVSSSWPSLPSQLLHLLSLCMHQACKRCWMSKRQMRWICWAELR